MGRRQASAAAIYRLLFLLPSLFSHPTQSRQQKPVFHLKTGQSWHIIGKATTEQIEDERHTHIMNGNGAAADDLLVHSADVGAFRSNPILQPNKFGRNLLRISTTMHSHLMDLANTVAHCLTLVPV